MNDNYYQAVIGNGRTAALIEPDATLSYCCLPDFDSGTSFAKILDEEKGGSFGIEMIDGKVTDRRYDHHTAIFITTFSGKDGSFELIDFMPRYPTSEDTSHEDTAPDVIRFLRDRSEEFFNHLSNRIRMKFTPVIHWHADDTPEQADRLSSLIDSIDIPDEEED